MNLIGLLITALIFAVICYVIFWAMGYLGVPEPIRKVVVVVVVVLAIIWILSLLGGVVPTVRLWR